MPSHIPNLDRELDILVVEDDLDDILLLETALADNKVNYKMGVITRGDKLMPYLQAVNRFPDIIVLDFNLPVKHGKEILKELSESVLYNHIPIVVLTTSSAKEDMRYAYDMGAKSFITKPTSIQGFNELISTLLGLIPAP